MSLLVLQIIIKQWDKGQRTKADIELRANIPDKYQLIFPTACYILDQQCVVDQHGDDIQGDRIKYYKNAAGNILLDRFQVCRDSNILDYYGSQSKNTPLSIGSVNQQWIQVKYNCRYSIFESDMYYWLYEEVTLNAISLNQLDEQIFLTTKPDIIFEDYIDLDKKQK